MDMALYEQGQLAPLENGYLPSIFSDREQCRVWLRFELPSRKMSKELHRLVSCP